MSINFLLFFVVMYSSEPPGALISLYYTSWRRLYTFFFRISGYSSLALRPLFAIYFWQAAPSNMVGEYLKAVEVSFHKPDTAPDVYFLFYHNSFASQFLQSPELAAGIIVFGILPDPHLLLERIVRNISLSLYKAQAHGWSISSWIFQQGCSWYPLIFFLYDIWMLPLHFCTIQSSCLILLLPEYTGTDSSALLCHIHISPWYGHSISSGQVCSSGSSISEMTLFPVSWAHPFQ